MDAGAAAKPLYATEKFSAFMVDDPWSTWAAFDYAGEGCGARVQHPPDVPSDSGSD